MQNILNFLKKIKNKIYLLLIVFLMGYILTEFIFSIVVSLVLKYFSINFENKVGVMSVFVLFIHAVFIITYTIVFNSKFNIKIPYKSRIETDLDNVPQNSYQNLFKIRLNFKYLFLGIILGVLSISIVIFFRYIFGYIEEFKFWNLMNNVYLILGNILITLFTATIEEYVFRRTIFVAMRSVGKSFVSSVIITSTIFSLFHVLRNVGLLDLIFFFGFSIFLCLLVEYKNTIWFGIGFHFAWNYISDGGYIFKLKYAENSFSNVLFIKLISIFILLILIIIHVRIVNKCNNK